MSCGPLGGLAFTPFASVPITQASHTTVATVASSLPRIIIWFISRVSCLPLKSAANQMRTLLSCMSFSIMPNQRADLSTLPLRDTLRNGVMTYPLGSPTAVASSTLNVRSSEFDVGCSMFGLLITERFHRIDPRGPAGGQKAGEHRHGDQKNGHAAKGQGIERAQTKEESRQHTRKP